MNESSVLIDEWLEKSYAKYVAEWSDAECPITDNENLAYRAGWGDCKDFSLQAAEAYQGVIVSQKQTHDALIKHINDLQTAFDQLQALCEHQHDANKILMDELCLKKN